MIRDAKVRLVCRSATAISIQSIMNISCLAYKYNIRSKRNNRFPIIKLVLKKILLNRKFKLNLE